MTNSASPLAVGTKPPDFALLSDIDESVSLSSFKGKTVVLYFYPVADAQKAAL